MKTYNPPKEIRLCAAVIKHPHQFALLVPLQFILLNINKFGHIDEMFYDLAQHTKSLL